MGTGDYMNAVTQGVYVIGTKNGEKKNLMTAAWLTQISSRPNQILVAISAGHYTAEILQKYPFFAVSVLAEGQEALALACGRNSGRTVDKTAQVSCRYDKQELPVLTEAAAYLLCEVKKIYYQGDHVLFAAEVIDGEDYGKSPMKYVKKTFF